MRRVSAPVVVAPLNGVVNGPRIGKMFCIAQRNVDAVTATVIFQTLKSERRDLLQWTGVLLPQ